VIIYYDPMPLIKESSHAENRVKGRTSWVGRVPASQSTDIAGHLDQLGQIIDKGFDRLLEQMTQAREDMAQKTDAIIAQHAQAIAQYTHTMSPMNNMQMPLLQLPEWGHTHSFYL